MLLIVFSFPFFSLFLCRVFRLVKWETGQNGVREVDVVPCNWLDFIEEKWHCWWPNHLKYSRVVKAIKDFVDPIKDQEKGPWQQYEVTFKSDRNFDSYEAADRKCEKYRKDQTTSGMNDSDAARTVNPKKTKSKKHQGKYSESEDGGQPLSSRKRPEGFTPKRQLSPSTSRKSLGVSRQSMPHSTGDNSRGAGTSGGSDTVVVQKKRKHSTINSFTGDGSDSSEGPAVHPKKIKLVPSKNTATKSIISQEDSESSDESVDLLRKPKSVPKEKTSTLGSSGATGCCDCDTSRRTKKFRRKVFIHLNNLTQKLLRLEASLKTGAPLTNESVVPGFKVPAEDPDMLLRLNQQLQDQENSCNLVKYLKQQGAFGPEHQVAGRVMSAVMTDRCGYFLVWEGSSCKAPDFLSDKQKIGMAKAMPAIRNAIEEALKQIAVDAAKRGELFSFAKARKDAMRWLVIRKGVLLKALKKDEQLPVLPWGLRPIDDGEN